MRTTRTGNTDKHEQHRPRSQPRQTDNTNMQQGQAMHQVGLFWRRCCYISFTLGYFEFNYIFHRLIRRIHPNIRLFRYTSASQRCNARFCRKILPLYILLRREKPELINDPIEEPWIFLFRPCPGLTVGSTHHSSLRLSGLHSHHSHHIPRTLVYTGHFYI